MSQSQPQSISHTPSTPSSPVPVSGTTDAESQGLNNQQKKSVSAGPLGKLHQAAQQQASSAIFNTGTARADREVENQLAVVRLGMATSLYYALRAKHSGVAAHGLRVALFASGWCESMGLDSELRDRIEVAALLHDVGKISVPDRLLRKPGKLTVSEQLLMDRCPEVSCDILRGCTNDSELLEIVRGVGTWFDGRREDETVRGDELPIGARMLSIVDAFDSMTTEHVYRPAMSLDRAMAELVHGSGTQFDSPLVIDFCRLLEARPELLQGQMVHRWLQQLRPDDAASFWTGESSKNPSRRRNRDNGTIRRETLFNGQLLQTLKDGVVMTDREGTIEHWNVAMEQMSGITGEAMLGKQWSIDTLQLRDADGGPNDITTCPLQKCFRSGNAVRRAMRIEMDGAEPISVHVEVAPVYGHQPGMLGSVIVIHDLSDRQHLERRLASLHQQSTLDPLTNTANRMLMDERLEEMVQAASAGGSTFSAIICDIDHFKRINDTYGHPAGDAALIQFSSLLRTHSRDGDLVARYGGEEFLLLAGSCDNATGSKRAESIRQALEQQTMSSLNGECMTASFGVTEYQSGDTSETIIARADRALLKAKDNGRNRVVQLGLGKMSEFGETKPSSGWLDWLMGSDDNTNTVVDILTPVPIDLAIEKLRGFIADHDADIVNVAENQLSLKVVSGAGPGGRRRIDHRISFNATLTLSDAHPDEIQNLRTKLSGCTKVHLELTPIRIRDRRRRELNAAVSQLTDSFRCYLMGEIMAPNS